ncbi:MAG: GTPase HflX [Treponema sp.]|jgi:GTP-binding protein HflX|nr:GTPase HflX [Treponema sp.]
MKETFSVKETPPRAFLVGIRDENSAKTEAESLAGELLSLADTLGLEIAGRETVHIRKNSLQYGMGSGKAGELSEKALSLGAECLVFDREISPSQQRNWEKLSGLAVIDRQELILQIFAGRARTREAVLQVRLAELYYSLPRLRHKYIDLNRQRGGRYGTTGSGEARLETDRRLVEQRILRLEGELEAVRRQRELQRKHRRRQGARICALVGYTNAGKSRLFNALTGADFPVEDKLFATLDSASRALTLPGGAQVILSDTVGFIRRLPHSLVSAFRSTLEEASLADLLIHVLDASDEAAEKYYKTTMAVLRDLGADAIPMITVLNKADKSEAQEALEGLLKNYPGAIPVSAAGGSGLGELLAKMEALLSDKARRFRFPLTRPDLAALTHRNGSVLSESYEEDYIEVEARIDEKTTGQLKEYLAD